MSVLVERREFSVADFHLMGEAGLFAPGERVELIEGEVVKMSPIGSRHAACVNRLNAFFNRAASGWAVVAVQNPVLIDDSSELEPDVALLRPREDFYAARHPKPADVLLLVEVADTSVEYDRGRKVPLYARAGIAEVWLVDLNADVVEIYARPEGETYRETRRAGRGEQVSSHNFATLSIKAEDILGQREDD